MFKRICPTVLVWLFMASQLFAQDPLPYAPIANPLPDTLDVLLRDSATIKIGRVRVNQAGYRPQDKKYFYYVGEGQSSFSVINMESGQTVATGSLSPKGAESSGQISMECYYNATLPDKSKLLRYNLLGPDVTGPIYEGMIPENVGTGRYKIRVGQDESTPFVIDERVYSWVRDAALKFFGVNRCGDSESWFHPACHTKDAVTGGWHDCGDHLKEGITQSYAHAMLGLSAAVFRDRDTDRYHRNQASTVLTDGIPDVLYEAKHGSDYILQAYDKASGNIESMVTSVGDFGRDHQWWGRPEFQDMMPVGRGGPPREARIELGANVLGDFAAGLAFSGKTYLPFDSAYGKKCISVAEQLYTYAKANQKSTETPAYNGNGVVNDEIALAAVALLWATGKRVYLDELAYDKTIGTHGNTFFPKFSFEGGWFENQGVQFSKDLANTDWASVHVPTLWSFFRLVLKDQQLCTALNITNEERNVLIERTICQLLYNLCNVSAGTQTIEMPDHGINWIGHVVKYNPVWMHMHTQQDWIWNRYQMGNIFEMYCYSDMAQWVQGMELPNSPATTDWKATEIREVMIRQMDYMLGINPWDVSMIIGIGDKNFNHPHHRAANPEGKNVPGAFYSYRPPVGALFASYKPTVPLHHELWEDYYHTETGIDASATMMVPIIGLAKDEPMNEPPTATVRTVYVGYDKAIIEIRQSRYGYSSIHYGEGTPSQTVDCDSASVFHRITLTGLKNGTTYSFEALVSDLFGNSAVIKDRGEYFQFTTLQNPPGEAQITNVKVCKVTSDSAEIFWYTPNGDYDSRVVYGETTPPATIHDGNVYGRPTRFHYVKIGGLKEKTTYYFYVESNGTRDDNSGNYYTFTTPVEHVNFDVRVVQYQWGGKPTLGTVVVNQESKTYDSLELRYYMRGTEQEMVDMGARVDIAFVYHSDGFIDTSFQSKVNNLLQKQKPIKIPDTYDPVTNTYAWYFRIPTGDTRMESQARFRIDIILVKRSPFSDDLLDEAPTHIPSKTSDWSWMPHSREAGDPVDYGGIQDKDKDNVDNEIWITEINPYVTVYRKNEFVWGYSPSASEQQTKKTHYEMTAQITSPLNNPSEEYIFLEQVVPTLVVKGWATITEGGVINDIWVNGKKLLDVSSVARYNFDLDRYDLTILVPVKNGGNNVDITIFGGPSTDCDQCFGCAFSNHSFYVEFRGAEAYPSSISLRDMDDSPLRDTARIDTTMFHVQVIDKNGNISGKTRDTVHVSIVNPVLGDSIYIALLETGDSTGIFRTINPITVVSLPPSERGPFQISMSGGDVAWVTYTDPNDPEDISTAYLATRADFPVPVNAWFSDKNGDGSIDRLTFRYSNVITNLPDSLKLTIPGVTAARIVKGPADGITSELNLVYFDLDPAIARVTGFRAGEEITARSYLLHNGVVKESVLPVADSAGPALLDRALLSERVAGPFDTIQVVMSEPVTASKMVNVALTLRSSGVDRDLAVLAVLDSSLITNALTLLVHPGDTPIQAGDSIFINPNGPVRDRIGNKPHPQNQLVPVILKSSIPRVLSAYYKDINADGKLDQVNLIFSKSIELSGLQLSFSWNTGSYIPVEWAKMALKTGTTDCVLVNIEGTITKDSIVTGGSMRVMGTHNKFPGDTLHSTVSDSAAPVIKSAVFAPSMEENSDTLAVTFSEPISPALSQHSFNFITAEGIPYTMTVSNQTKTESQTQYFLVTAIEGIEFPGSTDSVWINTEADVFDMIGNIQNNEGNRRCRLNVKPVPFEIKVVVAPNPFSNISANAAGFIGTKIIVKPISKVRLPLTIEGTFTIFDNLGNVVMSDALQPMQDSQDLTYQWNGCTRNGRKVGTGTYLIRVSVNEVSNDGEKREPRSGKALMKVIR